MAEENFRLSAITLDERTIVRRTREIEQERDIAIYDLLEANSFRPEGSNGGPYRLTLGIEENRLSFDISLEDDSNHGKVMLSLTPFRRVIKDYFLICDSYLKAIRGATPSRIEAVDMARRGLHNEGAEILRDALKPRVEVDQDTSRRLFTLVCVLHIRG
jgi:uncharacterized protein (UPF0262 family)